MERQEFEVLRTRVQRLERRMRVAVAGWVVSVVVVVLLGVAVQQAVSQTEVLRARRIEVVDAAGRRRIILEVLPDGTSGLSLWDAAGQARIALTVLPDGPPSVGLGDGVLSRILLTVLPDGTPGLSLRAAAGRTGISLSLLPDGSPLFSLQDAAGRTLFRAP